MLKCFHLAITIVLGIFSGIQQAKVHYLIWFDNINLTWKTQTHFPIVSKQNVQNVCEKNEQVIPRKVEKIS